jgi:hypothetical protein
MQDYERERLLAKGATAFVSDGEDSDSDAPKHPASSASFFEEQAAIKESIRQVGASGKSAGKRSKAGDADSGDGDDDDLFTVRQKTREELAQEEKDYLAWLKVRMPSSCSLGRSCSCCVTTGQGCSVDGGGDPRYGGVAAILAGSEPRRQ